MKPPIHSAILMGHAPAPDRRDGRRGFTLLEMLLAVTIFAILGVIILSTFRTGMKAYEDAERQANLVDQARFVFDQLSRDIHSSVIMSLDEYAKTASQKLEAIRAAYQKCQETGDCAELYILLGKDPDDPSGEEPPPDTGVADDPFESSITPDLSMAAWAEGDDATLTFAIRKPTQPGRPYDDWGLIRVTYKSKDGVLIRETNSIIPPKSNIFQEVIEEVPEPVREVMAEGVAKVRFQYGYWFDEVWIDSGEWDSEGRLRDSYTLLTADPDADPDVTPTPRPPEANQAPPDRAQAYVRITLQLADVKNPKRTETFSTLIRLPRSVETYVPNNTIDDDRMDAETDARINRGGSSEDESSGGEY